MQIQYIKSVTMRDIGQENLPLLKPTNILYDGFRTPDALEISASSLICNIKSVPFRRVKSREAYVTYVA